MNDDNYPRNAALAELVAQVRATPTPAVSVTADQVQSRLRVTHSGLARRIAGGLVAVAAVGLAMVWTTANHPSARPRPTLVEAASGPASNETRVAEAMVRAGAESVRPIPPSAERLGVAARGGAGIWESSGVAAGAPGARDALVRADKSGVADIGPQPSLAAGVEITTERGPSPAIVSSFLVKVAGGRYLISAASTVRSALEVRQGARVLIVEPGASVSLDRGKLVVSHGTAQWREPPLPPAGPDAQGPDAQALADRAEAAMARRDTKLAIATLRKLARRYPRAPATRTGLVDLARLYANVGDSDHARCAYRLVLQRWPQASIAPDIKRALARLGASPQSGQDPDCRGLSPR